MASASRLSPFLWLLGLLLLGGSVAGTGWALRRTDPGPGPAAQESPDEEAEVAVCEGHADTESGVVALNPTLPGRVVEVKVRENQEVAAGAVLLRVEDTLPRLRADEAAAALEAAQTQLTLAGTLREQYDRKLEQQRAAIRAAREAREAARQEADRQERLSRTGLINSELEAAARAPVCWAALRACSGSVALMLTEWSARTSAGGVRTSLPARSMMETPSTDGAGSPAPPVRSEPRTRWPPWASCSWTVAPPTARGCCRQTLEHEVDDGQSCLDQSRPWFGSRVGCSRAGDAARTARRATS